MDILISEDVDGPAVQRLGATYQVVRDPNLWKDTARLRELIGDARAIMIRNQTIANAELLAAAPKLLAIGRIGVGLDNIDVEMASKLGIVIISPLEANAVSVAELTMGLLLSLARKIPKGDRMTKAGGWDRRACMGLELDGKTLGICGFGRIGRLVASRARAFGMRIVVFDPFVKIDSTALMAANATHCASLDELLGQSHFVTTHSPLTTETKKMFNRHAFGAMKPGALFINTSRGGVVDEEALLVALKNGSLGGAALDVREIEPPATKVGFEEMENVIVTPHIGALTAEAQRRVTDAVSADVDRILQGQAAEDYVNFPKPAR